MQRKSNNRPNPAIRGMQSRWLAHEGRPSWHQARAGHISAGAAVFTGEFAETDALVHAARFRAHHPHEPVAVREELTPIHEVR